MKEITFIPINKDASMFMDPPIPAAKDLPDWYKEQPSIIGDKIVLNSDGAANITVKKCMPVLDDMTAGYYLRLASDTLFTTEPDGSKSCSWSLDTASTINTSTVRAPLPPLISTHSTEQVSHMPIPNEYNNVPFKWNNYWRIKTPKGYSCLFRHPSYSDDVPFITFSGLVDTDTHPVAINFPFIIRKDFEGLIPADTPIVQIIPFKRQEWHSCVEEFANEDGAAEFTRSSRKLMHRYKDNWRTLKLWK